jgi:prepilin signal peptidase PulO-like enzyme (type II secretory pathway)
MEVFAFLFYFFIFIFGSIIGSFLNSIIYRLEKPIKTKRSFCPYCYHKLSWKDLIPLLSFLFLKGKCRYCKKPISLQYPLVELFTACLFLLATNYQLQTTKDQLSFVALLYSWFVISFLVIIFVYDLKHFLIPNKIIYSLIGIVFVYRLLELFGLEILDLFHGLNFEFLSSDIINSFLSAIFTTTFFLSIFLVSRGQWLGFGDVKLGFLIGLFLGFPKILVALFLAFFIGAIIGIGLVLLKKKNLKSQIPLAPFLITGTFLAWFFGKELIDFYLRIFSFK